MTREPYKLTKQERIRIGVACRSWNGHGVSKQVREVCRDYRVEYSVGPDGHYVFALDGRKIRAPFTPSCWRNGRIFGKKLIKLIGGN